MFPSILHVFVNIVNSFAWDHSWLFSTWNDPRKNVNLCDKDVHQLLSLKWCFKFLYLPINLSSFNQDVIEFPKNQLMKFSNCRNFPEIFQNLIKQINGQYWNIETLFGLINRLTCWEFRHTRFFFVSTLLQETPGWNGQKIK